MKIPAARDRFLAVFKRSVRFSVVGAALPILSSCAELLAFLGLSEVVISGTINVEGGVPAGKQIFVGVSTTSPEHGPVFFESQPEFVGMSAPGFFEITGLEPGDYYVVAFLNDGDGQLDENAD